MTKRRDRRQAGFTLVELIIVIIILAILAAVAIPMFTGSTQDAKEATRDTDLTMLTKQIRLYYHEHGDIYPGAASEADGTTAVTGAKADAAFLAQMTQWTDATGKASATQSSDYPFGPYLQAIPANPLPDAATVTAGTEAAVDITEDLGAIRPDGKTGWKASSKTGKIIANNVTRAVIVPIEPIRRPPPVARPIL